MCSGRLVLDLFALVCDVGIVFFDRISSAFCGQEEMKSRKHKDFWKSLNLCICST